MDIEADDSLHNPLWEFSLATYSLEGVAPACIALQDTFGADVNLLLYAAWLAQMDRRLCLAHLTELEESIADWRDNVVQPLRSLRRQLGEYIAARAIREQLKALELQAEQQQQAMMHTFHRKSGEQIRAPRPLEANLSLVLKTACPQDERWAPLVQRLISLIPG
jgi:uncharacterized protein (TIGR02444 family)